MISDSEDYYSDSMMDDQDMMTRNANGFCTEAEKRAHHNALERKRRDHIKDSFMDLRDAIPTIRGKKTSRAEILTKALEFIRSKMDQLANERKFIDRLRRENHLIAEKLRTLENESDNENYKLFMEPNEAADCDELETTETGEVTGADVIDSADTAAAKADLENNLIPKVSRILEFYGVPIKIEDGSGAVIASGDENSDNDDDNSQPAIETKSTNRIAVMQPPSSNRKRADNGDDDGDRDGDGDDDDDYSNATFTNRPSTKSATSHSRSSTDVDGKCSTKTTETNLVNRTSLEQSNPPVRNKRFKCNNNV